MKRIAGSPDPIQQTLREHKAEWNAGVSELISNLIILKKIMNGREVPGFLGKGDIKYPLPPEVPQLLSQLTEYFSSIVQAGSKIISEQEEYSQTRNKGVKEASNFVSRFNTYVKAPFQFSDKSRGTRIGVLKQLVNIEDTLKDIENDLLTNSDQSIFNAFYKTLNVGKIFKSGTETLISAYINQLPKSTEESTQSAEVSYDEDVSSELYNDPSEQMNYEEMAKRYSQAITSASSFLQESPDSPEIRKTLTLLENSVRKAIALSRDKDQKQFIEQINLSEDYYRKLISLLPKEVQSDLNISMMKLSHNMVSRWFKKQLMNISTTDQTVLRKQGVKDIHEMYSGLNELMNQLHDKDFDVNVFIKLTSDFNKILESLFDTMLDLANLHNNMVRLKKLKAKTDKSRYTVDLIPVTDISAMRFTKNMLSK